MFFNLDELQLIHFADERMTTKPPAFDFEKDGDKAEELGKVLYKKMLEFQGVGLSANQIGLPYRVFVFGDEEKHYVMFNPNVVGVSKEQTTMEESCLSFPGFKLVLKRPASVAITWQNEKGEPQAADVTGLAARIILHEYDHMEGINFTYHASNFKLRHELTRFKKRQKKELLKQQKKALLQQLHAQKYGK